MTGPPDAQSRPGGVGSDTRLLAGGFGVPSVTRQSDGFDLLDDLLRDLAQLDQDVTYELTDGGDRTVEDWSSSAWLAQELVGDLVQEWRNRVWLAQLERRWSA